MKNPPKTPHLSIFEPLFSVEIEQPITPSPLPSQLCQPCPPITMKRASASSCLNDPPPYLSIEAEMDPSSTAPKKTKSEHDLLIPPSSLPDHGQLSSSSSPAFSPAGRGCNVTGPARNGNDSGDDGSVASRLLSITKSVSSPSLLSRCKEPSRETPYQKSLKLKTMKLQYCAEELGSESCDVSSAGGDGIFDCLIGSMGASMNLTELKLFETPDKLGSSMASAMSAPNLRCPSLHTRSRSSAQIVMAKERSFPPPLTRSSSLSYSLRPYREDGRFLLKEVKVSACRQYFQASRIDGRLTLQLLPTTSEEDTSSDVNVEDSNIMEENSTTNIRAECCDQAGDDNVMEDNSARTAKIEWEDLGDEEVICMSGKEKIGKAEAQHVDDVCGGEEVYSLEKIGLISGDGADDGDVVAEHVDVSMTKKMMQFNGEFHVNAVSNASMTKKMWSDARLSHEPGGPIFIHGSNLVQRQKSNALPRNSSPLPRGLLGGGGKSPPPYRPSTIVFKDVSLIQKISAMVASLAGLATAAYARDGQCKKMTMMMMKAPLVEQGNQGNQGRRRRRSHRPGNTLMIEGAGMLSGDKKGGDQLDVFSNGVLGTTCTTAIDEGGNKTVQLDFDMHMNIPSSSRIHLTALLNTINSPWTHTPHCKELSAAAMPTFIKLHCVAT